MAKYWGLKQKSLLLNFKDSRDLFASEKSLFVEKSKLEFEEIYIKSKESLSAAFQKEKEKDVISP